MGNENFNLMNILNKAKMQTTKMYTQVVAFVGLLFVCVSAVAQQPPPRPISVSFNPAQGLRFGAFYQSSSGGTVSVSGSGVRTATGSIVLADGGYVYGPASFEIVAAPGTLISILNGPDANLTGSAGGFMSMHVGSSYPSSPFISSANPPAYNTVNIGGVLNVGSPVANPSGAYNGSFYVTFIQE